MKYSWRRFLQKPLAMLLAAVLTFSFVPLHLLQIDAAVESSAENSTVSDSSPDLTGWKSAPVDGYTGQLTWQEDAAQLKTENAFGMESEKMIAVNPTGTYSFSYSAALSEGADLSAYVYYYTEEGYLADMPYERLSCHKSAGEQAQMYSTEFTVPADAYQITIRFTLNSQSGTEVTALLDDMDLQCLEAQGDVLNSQNMPAQLTAYDPAEQALLQAMRESTKNPAFSLDVNFEDGETHPWTLWSGASVSGGVLTQSADSNGYAEGSQHYAVTAGETYVLSAKIKAEGRSQAVYWLYE